MPLHTTSDPGVRARHIAEREADNVYRASPDLFDYLDRLGEAYVRTLQEMGLPEVKDPSLYLK